MKYATYKFCDNYFYQFIEKYLYKPFTRQAITIPVVVRPFPIWQLNTHAVSGPCCLNTSNMSSKFCSDGAFSSTMGNLSIKMQFLIKIKQCQAFKCWYKIKQPMHLIPFQSNYLYSSNSWSPFICSYRPLKVTKASSFSKWTVYSMFTLSSGCSAYVSR